MRKLPQKLTPKHIIDVCLNNHCPILRIEFGQGFGCFLKTNAFKQSVKGKVKGTVPDVWTEHAMCDGRISLVDKKDVVHKLSYLDPKRKTKKKR